MGTWPGLQEMARRAAGQVKISSLRQQEIASLERAIAEENSGFWNGTRYIFTLGESYQRSAEYHARLIQLRGQEKLFWKVTGGEAGFWMNTITAASPQGVGSRVLLGKDYITK